ncbi:MAG: DUF3530 family protein [Candidatus Sedimenticola sp. (ex Thyasira tokunagai)]
MRLLLLLCLVFFSTLLPASDLARERRISNEIEEMILDGEPVRLQAGGADFLAIYAKEESSYAKGAAIIIHGRGAHPDWTEVIQPMRTGLLDHGWRTFSIQMPIASAEAPPGAYRELIPEAGPRIAAAVDYLKKMKVENIVIISHSLGARMALEHLAAGKSQEVRALVTVGLSADKKEKESGTLGALQKLQLPMLDIYGSQDLQSVLGSVHERAAAAARAKNSDYRQTRIEGADHFFLGLDDTLISTVRAWLGKVAPGRKLK